MAYVAMESVPGCSSRSRGRATKTWRQSLKDLAEIENNWNDTTKLRKMVKARHPISRKEEEELSLSK